MGEGVIVGVEVLVGVAVEVSVGVAVSVAKKNGRACLMDEVITQDINSMAVKAMMIKRFINVLPNLVYCINFISNQFFLS